MKRSVGRLAVVLAALVLTGGASGCAGSSAPAPEPAPTPSVRVALVIGSEELRDGGFNQLADTGLQQAELRLGVTGTVLRASDPADRVDRLRSAAERGADLVLAVGFPMADAVGKVATQYPQTDFAIIDVPWQQVPGRPGNVLGIVFEQSQAGFLAGYLASSVLADPGASRIISAVGGERIPPVMDYIEGYRAGAELADPEVTVLTGYSGDFEHPAKCRRVAHRQIARGSLAVFQVAGACGLGALAEAERYRVLGIGVDSDQSFLGTHILTSAIKKVDVAVYSVIESVATGTFAGGRDEVYDLADGGVGLGIVGPAGTNYTARLGQVQREIVAGEIVVPSTTAAG